MTADTSTFTTCEQVKNNLGLNESTNGTGNRFILDKKRI